MAAVHHALQEIEHVGSLLKESGAYLQKPGLNNQKLIAVLYHNKGELMYTNDEYENSLENFKKGIDIIKVEYTKQSPFYIKALINVCKPLERVGEINEANEVLKRGINICLQTLGENHYLMAQLYHNYANVNERMGLFERILHVYNKSVEVC